MIFIECFEVFMKKTERNILTGIQNNSILQRDINNNLIHMTKLKKQ